LRAVKDKLEGPDSLCGFIRKAEREFMVWETISAAVVNLRKHGEPFSFRDNNVFAVHNGGLIDNNSAYRYLVKNGYFAEQEQSGRTVIFPTEKLLARLEAFLKIEREST
jgi:hypothetical protein